MLRCHQYVSVSNQVWLFAERVTVEVGANGGSGVNQGVASVIGAGKVEELNVGRLMEVSVVEAFENSWRWTTPW
jgi:hypothetical protein